VSASIKDWLPGLASEVEALAQQPAIVAFNHSLWIFSFIETVHLLAMAALGGAVLVLNLRLLGVVLTGNPPQQVERATRPFLLAGVVGTVATGLVMMLATAISSLPSTAFAVKMISLLAAIALSVVVSRQSRYEDADPGAVMRLLALGAAGLWLAALVLFASTRNLGAGSLLVVSIGLLLLATLLPGRRTIYLAVAAPVLLAGLGSTFLLPTTEEGDALAVYLSVATVAVAAAWALFNALRYGIGNVGQRFSLLQLAAFASILSWITVAAAGRWIGFS
jgi:hypothetical protein